MLQFQNVTRNRNTNDALPTVALVGGRYRREVIRQLLAGRAEVIAELESGNRIHLLDELQPDVVVIDTQTPHINVFAAVADARQLPSAPEVVLVGTNLTTLPAATDPAQAAA